MLDSLERGRAAYRQQAWRDAYACLLAADEASPLAAADLELLATAAYLTGREHDFQRFLDRAHHARLEDGDEPGAARCAFWVGLTLYLRGDMGQGSGWLARARRLVEDHDTVERGYLFLPVAEQHLGEAESDRAHAAATEAAEIGDRFGEADLIACARHLQGRALIQKGEVHAGLVLLDEAMLAAIAGELSPIMTGLIYCSLIAACQGVYALRRAREWTAALTRWCEQQPQMVNFTRTCLVHRAQIMALGGDWYEAMAATRRACEQFAQEDERPLPASVFYQQGELHRLRGEAAAAEEAYGKARVLGSEPQPGLALLRATQGRFDAACAAIRRVLGATTDPLRRAELLPAHIEIMLAASDLQEARRACHELEEIAGTFGTDVLQAMAAQARGAVELANGDAGASLGPLRRAADLWREVEAPYQVARARVLIGLACRALGDEESSELELGAARAVFEHLGAAPDLARLDSLAGAKGATSSHGAALTPRELEVLRLVAAGKTNKAIAAQLFLSERTIDRHVSNILNKLDVPSRAAATAYAYDHKLV